jgi:hypothetical protein
MEFRIGTGLACAGLAVAIGQWLIPPDKITHEMKFDLTVVASVLFLVGVSLLVHGFFTKHLKGKIQSPRLGIVLETGKPYLQQNYSTLNVAPFVIHGTLFTYRIGIINKGDSTISDVEVKLTNIKECPPNFNATGGHLHWEHDNPPEGQPYRTNKSIPPTTQQDNSDAVFVDVLQYFLPHKLEEIQYAQLQVCHVVPLVPTRIPLRRYQLTITAHDQHQATVAATLHLEPQDRKPPRLKFQKHSS